MKRAILLLLVCGAAPAACLIGGAVRDADSAKPLARVHVFAKPIGPAAEAPSGRAKPAILRVTDSAGAFCFDSLEPGVYSLVAQHAGYLTAAFGAKPGHAEGTTAFTVDGREALPPVIVRMVAGATLGGTVVDDRAQPAENVMVDLQRKVFDLVWKPWHVIATTTGPGGAFRFPMVAPGTYYVRTDPLEPPGPGGPFYEGPMMDDKGRPMAATSAVTYYSGAYEFAHATPVVLKAGQEIDNLLLAMKPRSARRISGRVAIPVDPKAFANAEVDVAPSIEIGGLGGRPHSGAIQPDGTFNISDLRPVEQEVTVDGLPGVFWAKVDLSGGDRDGLILEPLRTVDLAVATRLEGQEAPPTASLAICNIEHKCDDPVEPDAKGVYRFGGVRQGLYRFRSRTAGLYVKSVVADGRALGGAPLDLRKGAPESIAMVLGANLASLDGSLEHPEHPSGQGVSVVLVNEIRFSANVSNDFIGVDHNGRFHFDSVMPGKYRVLAIEGFDDGPWGSPELFAALRDKSVAVEIGDGEKKTITVPLVPVAEWEAALRKVGM